jgi:hypothetical protein
MQSKMTPEGIAPEETDPHDIFVIEPQLLQEDRVVLAARVDPPFAEPSPNRTSPAPKEASPVEDIMGDILSRPSTPKLRVVPEISVAAPVRPAKPARPVDTPFRATAATADAIANEIKIPGDIHPNIKPRRGAWAKRAAFGFLFALGSAAAAEGWDRYGDTARQMIADWTPALAQQSSPPAATAGTTAASPQPASPAVDAAVTDQTPAPPAPAALQPAPDAAASPLAAPPPSAQTLQSMAGDLAAMGQQIEALKASIAQLKAGQEQMAQQISRDIVKNAVARNAEAKASEVRPPERPHVLGTPPRPLQPPMRKPPHDAYAPPPTAAAINLPPPPYPARPPIAAPAPIDSEAPDGGPVVRPPMPLH